MGKLSHSFCTLLLAVACSNTQNAKGTNDNLVAVKDSPKDSSNQDAPKDEGKEADMKEVILHVFGMT